MHTSMSRSPSYLRYALTMAGVILLLGRSAEASNCQLSRLLASDAADGDRFGRAVSLTASMAVAGAPFDDDAGSSSGSAYVFELDDAAWIQRAKLTATDAAAGDQFGTAVAISGNRQVIGAPFADAAGTDSGLVYVFRRDGAEWVQEARLSPLGGAANDQFGQAVGITADRLVVGAPFNDGGHPDAGAAFVFRLQGTTWVQEARLAATDASDFDRFGWSASIDGIRVLAGAPFDDDAGPNSGSAYVFRRDGTSWVQEAKLAASGGLESDQFGTGVSLRGTAALIGSPLNDDGGTNAGAAYVFRFDGFSWAQEDKLTAFDPGAGDEFGGSVGVDGALLVVGAALEDNRGSAYVYRQQLGDWVQAEKLPAAAAEDQFGGSVSISGNRVLAGARLNDQGGISAGAAYIFAVAGADCNSNGQLDECEIASSSAPDCNSNGVPDSCDLASGASMDLNADGRPDECESVTITVTRMADTSTPIPSGTGNFQTFRSIGQERGSAVFIATGSSAQEGVYRYTSAGALVRVADKNTVVPDSTGNFRGFISAAISDTSVAFIGLDAQSNSGVYTNAGGALRLLVDRNSVVPGSTGAFSDLTGFGFAAVAYHGSWVAFWSSLTASPSEGIFRVNVDTRAIEVIANRNTPIPSGSGNFTALGYRLSISGDDIAFVGEGSSSRSGIYRGRPGNVGRVIDETSATESFVNAVPSIDGASVAYRRRTASTDTIVGGVVPASTTTAIPNGVTNFAAFSEETSLDDNNLVFTGTGEGDQHGLYIILDGPDVIGKVIDRNALFDGRQLNRVTLGPESLDGYRVAFVATFLNSTQGVYLVLIPQLCDQATINQQPVNQNVCEGNPAVFTVGAIGTPPLRYQWRRNGVDISGATGTSYTVQAVGAQHVGQYAVVVSNDCGSVTSHTVSLEIDAGPRCVPQACCFSDGACSDELAVDCSDMDGMPEGAGTSCSTFTCPAPTQSCCFLQGGCIDLSPDDCMLAEGSPAGPGTSCGTTQCPATAIGACCLPGGACGNNVVEAVCRSSGGVFMGDGTTCATVSCAGAPGACCLSTGACDATLTQDQCEEVLGTFRGEGVACASISCPQPNGACCLTNGGCLALLASQCAIIPGGSWAGPLTTCADGDANGRADACEAGPSGDIDGDGDTDMDDLDSFVMVLLGQDADPAHRQRSDVNRDGSANGLDINGYVAAFIGG